MTITLNLSPDLEAKLHNKASQEGKEINQVITELLTTILEWEIEDTKEAIKGIQRGLTDFESGNYRNFDDFAEEQTKKYNL
jgi:predicted transcriptional regulator